MNLREALSQFAVGWRDDLPPSWRAALAGVDPDPLAVASTLTFAPAEPIYPSRRGTVLAGARADAHVFRAFDDISLNQVRCVLIGQDPYPLLSRATGRAFEQGDISAWPSKSTPVASSLRNLVRMLVAARTGNSAALTMSWASLVEVAASPSLEPPRELFDRLQLQGVMCLNAGLTITRYKAGGAPEQKNGHIPFWRPVVGQTLRSIAKRQAGHVVFLCLGQYAQKLLVRERIASESTAAGTWGTRASQVSLPHPVAAGFIRGPNPFLEVNTKLVSMGAAPIDW